jgi:hypothetical protein
LEQNERLPPAFPFSRFAAVRLAAKHLERRFRVLEGSVDDATFESLCRRALEASDKSGTALTQGAVDIAGIEMDFQI